ELISAHHGGPYGRSAGLGEQYIGETCVVGVAAASNPALGFERLELPGQRRGVDGQMLRQHLLAQFAVRVEQNQYAPARHRQARMRLEAGHERPIAASDLLHETQMMGLDHVDSFCSGTESAALATAFCMGGAGRLRTNEIAGRRNSQTRPASATTNVSTRPACTAHTSDSRACRIKVSPCRPTRCSTPMKALCTCALTSTCGSSRPASQAGFGNFDTSSSRTRST